MQRDSNRTEKQRQNQTNQTNKQTNRQAGKQTTLKWNTKQTKTTRPETYARIRVCALKKSDTTTKAKQQKQTNQAKQTNKQNKQKTNN